MTNDADVMRVADVGTEPLMGLLHEFGLTLCLVDAAAKIPASYWGEPEAGIVECTVFVRSDTPVHSVLHETCHLICASSERRSELHTDARSGDLEEAAVCYLQILLADVLPGVGRDRLMQDMDTWGYSFRLGSSRAWFEKDAEDALFWLESHGLVKADGTPYRNLRN